MAIPSNPPVLPIPIANAGDVRSIPDQTPVGSNQLSFQSGFPPITSNPLTAGGVPPQREDFNAALKLLSQHVFFQQSGGIYPWQGAADDFPGLNYLANFRVLGSDGIQYAAIKPSGPDVVDEDGVVGPKDPSEDDGTYWLSVTATAASAQPYELCEFYYFRHPALRPGFQPAQGGLIADAATSYPEAWAYLQTAEGQKLCRTEEEWQAMTTATWATLADGSTVGWNGIGGAPFYALHTDTGSLRLPDLRGMYAEAAGFDALDVGGAHGDAVRNIVGTFGSATLRTGNGSSNSVPTGPFTQSTAYYGYTSSPANALALTGIDASITVPTAAKNQPRAWGALACVYLGAPR